MIDRATLEFLAQRVERESPSRELDAEIDCARYGYIYLGLKDGGYLHDWPAKNIERSTAFQWSRYTSSLDAAASLMPEGWIIQIGQIRFGMWRVQLWRGDKSFKSPADVEAVASTEPQARVAAGLRARAAIEPDAETAQDRPEPL